jgi:radical SAM superfamily enzyme YgiQ (UPF0313 family)
MKRKLVLVNPVNPVRTGLTLNKSSRFPPIGLGIVAALTPEEWDVELVDENWESFDYRAADLVGITAFTAAANRAYEIAKIYRHRGVPVVMGGIHASMCTAEALQYVDSVVVGEAEVVWPKLITDFENGQLQPVYQGEWGDLAGLPAPRRDLFHPGYMFASLQTSRGCPMDCDFCSVTAFNGRRYRRRPAEEVLAELEQIPQKFIFIVDDNIIGYGGKSRQQALELFKGMVARKLNKLWFCQASLNFADDEEVLHWAAKAGCKMVFLGLEAEDVDALNEVNKRLNLKMGVDAYAQAFQRIHRAGISVLGAFIFGMDEDTQTRLWRRTNYMIQSDIDVMQVTFLTPLPGTRLFERLKTQGRLYYVDFPKDWDRFDMGDIVHRPKNICMSQLAETTAACQRRMYSWPALLRKVFRTGMQTRDLMTTMFAWQSNVNYRNVSFGKKLSLRNE